MKGGGRGAGGGMVFISCWEARRRNFRGGQKGDCGTKWILRRVEGVLRNEGRGGVF